MAKIVGTGGRSLRNGTTEDDNDSGLGEEDTLLGGADNDSVYGGYTASGSEGTDTLINVERVQFSDTNLMFDSVSWM